MKESNFFLKKPLTICHHQILRHQVKYPHQVRAPPN